MKFAPPPKTFPARKEKPPRKERGFRSCEGKKKDQEKGKRGKAVGEGVMPSSCAPFGRKEKRREAEKHRATKAGENVRVRGRKFAPSGFSNLNAVKKN